MAAQELFEAGELREAIQAQNAQVKAHPTDVDARYQLVVLLAFAGELDRAFLQLDTIARQEPELAPATGVYRSLINAEAERWAVFNKEGKPLLPPDCPEHVELRVEAVEAMRAAEPERAAAALDRANEKAAALRGELNGEPFDAIRDTDDLLGPVLEVYAGGKYLWVPLDHVCRLEVSEPQRELDLLWTAAQLLDVRGEEASVHLPVLYEGSHEASEGQARIGRVTDWIDWEGVLYRGVGQKVLLSARGDATRETALLEVRNLELADAPSGGASDG